MVYVVFRNKGVMDMRAIRTFGVSVKDTENPIGFFGTGLKYAIAILVREGCEIQIDTDRTYRFSEGSFEMRGKEFKAIKMNDEELPFTTHLGTHWELWQAFRELYCNALDEGGSVELVKDFPPAVPGETRIIVKGEDFTKVFFEKDSIVLNRKNPLAKTDFIEIYAGESDFLYYRGVRVKRIKKSAYTYNLITQMDLTEDRTLESIGLAENYIVRSISMIDDEGTIRDVVLANKEYFEHDLSFGALLYYNTEGETFLEVVGEEFKRNNDRLNRSVRTWYQGKLNMKASKNYERIALTAVEESQLDRAKKIILKSFPDFEDYGIMPVKSLGQVTMALADHDTGTMVISRSAFEKGTKYLVSTLIEEYMHLKTEFGDLTRELQTHLFDTICSMIENHVINEPI